VEFDEAVDRFGSAVAGSAGVEVGQECFPPSGEGLAQAFDLRDRAGGERGEDLLGEFLSFAEVVGSVGGAQLLGAPPGDLDLDMGVVGGERLLQAGLLLVGELVFPAAQDVAVP
jgi:hypothetical protein